MARYAATVSTITDVERAFDYLAEFSSVRDWDPTVVRAENISGRVGKGARFRVAVRFAGRENEFVYDTIEFERPARIVLRAESPGMVSLDTISFRAVGDGTEVTYDALLEPKGLIRLAAPILGRLFKRLGDNAAAGLKRELSRL